MSRISDEEVMKKSRLLSHEQTGMYIVQSVHHRGAELYRLGRYGRPSL